jgi:hypothetical protein
MFRKQLSSLITNMACADSGQEGRSLDGVGLHKVQLTAGRLGVYTCAVGAHLVSLQHSLVPSEHAGHVQTGLSLLLSDLLGLTNPWTTLHIDGRLPVSIVLRVIRNTIQKQFLVGTYPELSGDRFHYGGEGLSGTHHSPCRLTPARLEASCGVGSANTTFNPSSRVS